MCLSLLVLAKYFNEGRWKGAREDEEPEKKKRVISAFTEIRWNCVMDIGHYITKQPLKGNEKLPQIADGSDKRGYSQFYCYAH